MKHKIQIDLHDAKKSIDDICILGSLVKDENAKKYLESLNIYLQNIWSNILNESHPHEK
jgi:hypothetical protein